MNRRIAFSLFAILAIACTAAYLPHRRLAFRQQAAAGAWSPSDLASLEIWLIGDDCTNAAGDAVRYWNPASPTTVYASNAAGSAPFFTNSFLNGHGIVNFVDSANTLLYTPFADTDSNYTVCVVAAFLSGSGKNFRLLDKSYSAGFWVGQSSASTVNLGGGFKNTSSPYGVFIVNPNAQWNGVVQIRSGTTLYTYDHDGNSTNATCGSGLMDSTSLMVGSDGADNEWDGGVAEIIYFQEALSDANRDNLLAYIRTKYGL